MTPNSHVSPGEQYFTAAPSSPERPKELAVELAGMSFQVHTAAGVFSGDRLDKGTSVLLRKVPELPESGIFVDVGCGWGPLTLVMARLRPEAEILAVDVNARARELTAINAKANGLPNVRVLDEAGAFAELSAASIDVIWSNPPVRIGKTALHNLWDAWREKLKIGGEAYLVMGKNLGSDPFLDWALNNGWNGEKIASSKGFRVLKLLRKL